jgi:NADH:ubiquinone oxidoreductase subunit K
MVEPLTGYLIVSGSLLAIGIYGLVAKRNALRLLFAIEIIVNAANINFLAFAAYQNPPNLTGQVIVFYSIATAAMEAAVGLALFLVFFRLNGTMDLRKLSRLRG